ncbi:hypothetical protein AN964_22760 [Heyndrickxia shackletonii]|uniref:Uncharacterized protein n=1 Tax=Heyndrickxia shackletonii TaxID=157838 RepID=A0A0Q3WRU9_9BACI|nr:hypothetical protein [Heyndrickxia shackletonii]KQL50482.1 hypothetical protein AN964_22760 [Heyndrickxia shackletonii]NEZ01522.1 hypothetical protein [Heyndrickxia shackletonii]
MIIFFRVLFTLMILCQIIGLIYLHLNKFKSKAVYFLTDSPLEEIDSEKMDHVRRLKVKSAVTIQSLIFILISVLYMIDFKEHGSDIRIALIFAFFIVRYGFKHIVNIIIKSI